MRCAVGGVLLQDGRGCRRQRFAVVLVDEQSPLKSVEKGEQISEVTRRWVGIGSSARQPLEIARALRRAELRVRWIIGQLFGTVSGSRERQLGVDCRWLVRESITEIDKPGIEGDRANLNEFVRLAPIQESPARHPVEDRWRAIWRGRRVSPGRYRPRALLRSAWLSGAN